jgi:hypothetical protein
MGATLCYETRVINISSQELFLSLVMRMDTYLKFRMVSL